MFGSHDPSVVLLEEGEILYGIEEERLTRQKHAPNSFPENAIRSALDSQGISLSDINKVAIPWEPKLYTKSLMTGLKDAFTGSESMRMQFYQVGQATKQSLVSNLFSVKWLEQRLADIDAPVPEIETYSHHRSHAASVLYPFKFDNGLILSVDGRGEYDSTVVWEAKNGILNRHETYEYPNSLGLFFGSITKFLGYHPNNGEGKVMGLAPYGERNEEIEDLFRDYLEFGVDYDVTRLTEGGFDAGVETLEELFGRSRNQSHGTFDQWEKDLARVSQHLLEETVLKIVNKYARELDTTKLGLTGGVALNCKMNKRLMESDSIENISIQPVAHDAGSAIGAAYLASEHAPETEQSTIYWGPKYETDEITDILDSNKLSYSKPDELERIVAQELADGSLVGWFQGRTEMGPRALGNRSILADPRTTESRDRVNKYVKHRENWRPFAPSMKLEAASNFLIDAEPSPYMIKTFDTHPEIRDEIEAVLHPADKTTRPQTITENQNPIYYRLLSEFESITGVPVLLNTSFNDHAEPIVNTPVEAVKDFFGMGLDILVLEDFIVRK